MQSVCFVLGSPVRTRTWIEWLTATCSAIELQENSVKSFENVLLTIYYVKCRSFFSTLVVGITGFEPATSCSRNMRATKLRHIPNTTTTSYVLCCVSCCEEWWATETVSTTWPWGRASGFLYLSLLVVCKMFSLNYAPSQCSSSLPIRDLNPFTRNLSSLVF